MRKQLSFLLPLLLCFSAGNAQRYFGVATGQWNATNSVYLNPANIADAHEKVEVNLFSMNVGVDNNLGTFSKLGDLTTGNAIEFKNNNTSTFSMLIPVVEVRGPSFIVSLNNKFKTSFGFSTRLRAINQFDHFDQSIYNTIQNPGSIKKQDYAYSVNNFNWTAHVWHEYGISYAMVPYDNGVHKVKVGATLRYLGGIGYLGIKSKNLDIKYSAGTDTFQAANSDLEFASNLISAANAKSNGLDGSSVFSNFFGAKAHGFGGDIGVTYSYTPGEKLVDLDGKAPESDYLVSVSAAITDFGSIKYKQGENYVVNVSGTGYVTGQGLSDNIKTYDEFRNYAVNHGFRADTASKDTKVYMPTAMVLGVDYKAYKRLYLNLTYVGNLANRQNFGNSYYGQVTVTPRYDSKILSVGVPVTYSMLANDIKCGLGIRFSGFFLGADDMLGLFSSNQHGFSTYFGGCIPISKKNKKPKFGRED